MSATAQIPWPELDSLWSVCGSSFVQKYKKIENRPVRFRDVILFFFQVRGLVMEKKTLIRTGMVWRWKFYIFGQGKKKINFYAVENVHFQSFSFLQCDRSIRFLYARGAPPFQTTDAMFVVISAPALPSAAQRWSRNDYKHGVMSASAKALVAIDRARSIYVKLSILKPHRTHRPYHCTGKTGGTFSKNKRACSKMPTLFRKSIPHLSAAKRGLSGE